jgi:vancomycin resistance protein YoaR
MALAIITGYSLAFRKLIYPRIKIAGIEVTGTNKEEALRLVSTYFETKPNQVVLMAEGKEVANLNSIKVEWDDLWAVDQALGIGRSGNILTKISEQVKTLVNGAEITVPVRLDRTELRDLIEELADKEDQQPVWPKLVREGKEVKVILGKNGVEIKKDDLTTEVLAKLALPGRHEIKLPEMIVDTSINSKTVAVAMAALNKWGDKKLTLRFRDYQKTLSFDEIMTLFGLTNETIDVIHFETMVNTIRPAIEVEPRDAVFIFENNKVNEFKPEVIGATIDIPNFKEKLAEALLAGEEKELEIPTILTYPKIRTGDINNLGIKELIGSGKSTFFHSIPGRVFNVNLAASRVNWTLVAPGEEFSFVNAVGDISKATGYQTAYIISAGRTVLGDGGGVCQVSTTTFRAALDAGLPITERKAHAYRVGYYEQDSPPGIDATVYYPTADLKFLNDTGNYILIQEEVDTKKLAMKVNIYGTSDGRKSSLSAPRISNQSAPPPTMYIDDPTLPLGTTKQVDWSAWGAKVVFDYKVVRNGESIYEKTFVSNYQPWQAIYLKGTGDLAAR